MISGFWKHSGPRKKSRRLLVDDWGQLVDECNMLEAERDALAARCKALEEALLAALNLGLDTFSGRDIPTEYERLRALAQPPATPDGDGN